MKINICISSQNQVRLIYLEIILYLEIIIYFICMDVTNPETIKSKDFLMRLIKDYLYGGNPRELPKIGTWNVSNVKDMSGLFRGVTDFDEDISGWDVSNVTNMSYMFASCQEFDQPLNDWKVGNVTNMDGMFMGCHKFNQPLTKWKVDNVTSYKDMFKSTHSMSEYNKPEKMREIKPHQNEGTQEPASLSLKKYTLGGGRRTRRRRRNNKRKRRYSKRR
jgi:surface protein